jgi:hypothetical protein
MFTFMTWIIAIENILTYFLQHPGCIRVYHFYSDLISHVVAASHMKYLVEVAREARVNLFLCWIQR